MFESNISVNASTNSSCMNPQVLRFISVTFQETSRQKIGEKWATTAVYGQKLSYKWEESLLCKLYLSQSEPSLCNICTKTQPWHHQGVPTSFKEFPKSIYSSVGSEHQKNSYNNEISELNDFFSLELNFSVNGHINLFFWADDIIPDPRCALCSIMVIFESFGWDLYK